MPPLTWLDHLAIGSAVASIGDHDPGKGFALMAYGLHLLQRDLISKSERLLSMSWGTSLTDHLRI